MSIQPVQQPAFYVTTPIYYVNGEPHIGHAYTTIACDVIARFKRLDGFKVHFLTGTDEHGQKVAKSAAERGIEPIAFCDEVSALFRELAQALGATNDDFIRTTEKRHIESCQELWRRLEKNGHIYLDKYAGWYSVRDEAFFDEEELTSGQDGTRLAPTGAPVEWVEEESYFFDLSKWQDKLLEFYDSNPDFIGPKSRLNEVRSFVAGGLRDLSISRTTFSWGIPVPGNDRHIMYVWIDALTNYITGLGFPQETDAFKTFWPESHHVIGKEIIRFHCVYWPAFLMGAGLPVPKRIFAHGWWTAEGQKMSKSVGNVIDPYKMIDKYGLDQLRYFLLREVPFGNDGDFSESAIGQRINGELANEFGNLAQRFLSFIAKNLGGVLPEPGALNEDDNALLEACHRLLDQCRDAINQQSFNGVLDAIWLVVRAANGYVDKQAPWALRKTDPARMNTVLYVLAEATRHLAILMQPFVPSAVAKLLDQLAVPENQRSFAFLGEAHALKGGTPLPAPQGVFPRYTPPGEGPK
ncbi:MAG: methionine--tRNA ligase [Proteobacteria bacterium]|nr:methionine--tRNA ligase [Pseudomonadota bacterium]